MKRWLHLLSYCPKEFYNQVNDIFRSTANGIPFDFYTWEYSNVSAVEFKGTWLKRKSTVCTNLIGDIIFGDNDEIIVRDYTVDAKLSRLVKRVIGHVGNIITLKSYGWEYFSMTDDHNRMYKMLKGLLLDYLAIENHPRANSRNGISFREFAHLHYKAIKYGFFDIANVAFTSMLKKKISWEKMREITKEHYQTHLKSTNYVPSEDESDE